MSGSMSDRWFNSYDSIPNSQVMSPKSNLSRAKSTETKFRSTLLGKGSPRAT